MLPAHILNSHSITSITCSATNSIDIQKLPIFSSTPGILDNTQFKRFWVTWNEDVMKKGYGFQLGENIFMQETFPNTTDINYLAFFNGWGYSGEWKLYTSNYQQFCYFPTFDEKLEIIGCS